ncbi:hypothetical protein CK203_030917 [Vitis vinifera]|uniref:DUF295 domain-containing protein n=1 Tax=Vitis vinifera TaxID=29760 RepID=A0A438I1G1_VITVI|nr:hypothetical protein CK203_030917 [Vitis vinifera]
MEGEEFLYLYTYHRILVINMKKLLSGGFQTAPPDMTRLPVDEVIDFDEENLPCGMGFFVDGSKLYMVGGEWAREDPIWKVILRLDKSKGDKGISSSLYVADLSGPTVNFTHVHEFEAAKLMPRLIKIEGRIYVISSNYSYYAKVRTYASPSFESYCPGRYYEPNTMLQTPPFHEFPECSVTGCARVGNYLCFEAGRQCHYYNFVSGCEDVLVSAYCRNMEAFDFHPPHHMEAFLFPPPESGEDAPVLCQKFKEVDDDLSKIAKSQWTIREGLVLNLGKEKMCAIFPGQCHPNHQFLVYIFIFKFPNCHPMNNILPSKPSEPSEPRAPEYVLSQHQKDFISITCLHKGCYNLDEFGYDFPRLTGAFCM